LHKIVVQVRTVARKFLIGGLLRFCGEDLGLCSGLDIKKIDFDKISTDL